MADDKKPQQNTNEADATTAEADALKQFHASGGRIVPRGFVLDYTKTPIIQKSGKK